MILGTVVGEIHSTINHPLYDGEKLLVIERLDSAWRPTGNYLIAIDRVDAGVGETVLMIDEGNSARQILNAPNGPIRSMVVGIIDEVTTSAGTYG